MGTDKLFSFTISQIFLLKSLSEYDVDFILDVFIENPDITLAEFKEFIFNENPELYNKLIKFNLID